MSTLGTTLTLRLVKGRLAGQEVHVSVGDRFLIGRDHHCGLRLHAHAVSRVHCLIHHGANGFAIQDCMSKNGTLLNDRRVGALPVVVHTGDVVQIGPFVFRLLVAHEPPRGGVPGDVREIHWIDG